MKYSLSYLLIHIVGFLFFSFSFASSSYIHFQNSVLSSKSSHRFKRFVIVYKWFVIKHSSVQVYLYALELVFNLYFFITLNYYFNRSLLDHKLPYKIKKKILHGKLVNIHINTKIRIRITVVCLFWYYTSVWRNSWNTLVALFQNKRIFF